MKNTKELLEENRQWVEETFKKVDAKLSKVTVRSRDKLADGVAQNGVHRSTSPTNWIFSMRSFTPYRRFVTQALISWENTANSLPLLLSKMIFMCRAY